jgi:hypothetical protein
MKCLNILARNKGMIDPTPNEEDALEAASQTAGEFLESIGKTDLAQLEREEWESLIESVVTGYSDRLRELADQDQEKMQQLKDHKQERVPG